MHILLRQLIVVGLLLGVNLSLVERNKLLVLVDIIHLRCHHIIKGNRLPVHPISIHHALNKVWRVDGKRLRLLSIEMLLLILDLCLQRLVLCLSVSMHPHILNGAHILLSLLVFGANTSHILIRPHFSTN